MKKIFYFLATAALVFGTTTFSTANEMGSTSSLSDKIGTIRELNVIPDSCEPVHYLSTGNARHTRNQVCEIPASAARLNAAFFSDSDAAIVKLFKDETTIKLNDEHEADLIVAAQFFLENETSIAIR